MAATSERLEAGVGLLWGWVVRKGRGVARVDGPGSPPAPSPVAAAAAVVPEELEVVIKVVIS